MFEVPLVNGRGVAVIDDDDFPLVQELAWYLHSRGYACTAGGAVLMHRKIMDAPKGLLVDHRDGNRLNNQRHNLRVTTYSRNGINRQSADRRSTTGVPGVQKVGKKFDVFIWNNCKNRRLGTRGTLLEAARLRESAEIKIHGEVSPALMNWLNLHKGDDLNF